MAFVFGPDAAKNWSNGVVEILNGGPASVKGCSMEFNKQIEKLVQPDVWTGSAAAQNFKNFMDTHNALIKFTNTFGNSFSEAMTNVSKGVENLEVSNLGADSTVVNRFGTIDYSAITEMSEANINKEIVTYDYGVISEIGGALKTIKGNLESVRDSLNSKIGELNNGTKMWDGNAAEESKGTLTSIITTNMTEIFESLDICISNISEAARAAQAADSNGQ